MSWLKKPNFNKHKFNKDNFWYRANGHVVRMIDNKLYIDDNYIDKLHSAVIYDLAICLGACIGAFKV